MHSDVGGIDSGESRIDSDVGHDHAHLVGRDGLSDDVLQRLDFLRGAFDKGDVMKIRGRADDNIGP